MGVVVFDSDVLIGFMDPEDAHHAEAIAWMREATRPQTERWISAVNYSELLVGPIAKGKQEHVKAMLTNLSITTATVDMELAERAAAVRERTKLKLPDAYGARHGRPARAPWADRRSPCELRQARPSGTRRPPPLTAHEKRWDQRAVNDPRPFARVSSRAGRRVQRRARRRRSSVDRWPW